MVVFSTPMGTRFADLDELERLTGEPVRWEYRMSGTGITDGEEAFEFGEPGDVVLDLKRGRHRDCRVDDPAGDLVGDACQGGGESGRGRLGQDRSSAASSAPGQGMSVSTSAV